MISEKHEDHDDQLMRIVTGDESAESASALALFQRCELCRAEYEELRAVQDALDEDAADADSYEREPKAPLSASDRNALAALRASIGPTVAPVIDVPDAAEPLRFTKRWALAAALLVAAAGAAFLGKRYQLTPKTDEPGRRGDTLGGKHSVRLVFPCGPVAAVNHFEVAFEGTPRFPLTFVVRDARTKKETQSLPQRTTTWILSDEELKRLPSEFEWSVLFLNDTGDTDEGGQEWRAASIEGNKSSGGR